MTRIALISMHTCPLACPEGMLGGRETGGLNVYVRELSRELARRGISVDVFTRFQDTDTPQIEALGFGARVIHLPAGPLAPYDKNKLVNHVGQFAEGIEEFARREGTRYDLVHGHYWVSGLVAHRLQEDWGVPMVQMFHTLGQLKNSVAKSAADKEIDARIEIESRVIAWADRVIAATPLERSQMVWCYGAELDKVTVIPAGVDTSLFYPRDRAQVREQLGLPDLDTPILLFVGRIERLKGIDTLLESVAVVSRTCSGRNLKVLIVGGGGQTEAENAELRRVVQLHRDLNLEEQVEFVGSKPQEMLPLYYAAADITVMPSHYESFGLVAVEAMASGTPVIASNVGGLSFTVKDGETGYLVPEENHFALAEQVHTLLKNPELRLRMGEEAATHAQQYSWSNIADQIVAVYNEEIALKYRPTVPVLSDYIAG
ncbi:MAG TPA: glycosyltransferase [Chloroflexia bacterium]|nr:glycosyltransferase [Chloroflexia bacterium]